MNKYDYLLLCILLIIISISICTVVALKSKQNNSNMLLLDNKEWYCTEFKSGEGLFYHPRDKICVKWELVR